MNASVNSNTSRLDETSFQHVSIADARKVTAGTVFVRRQTPMPNGFEPTFSRFSRSWHVLNGTDALAFEKHLRDFGWSFSFIAPAITAKAYGRRSEGIERRAVQRVLGKVEKLGMNAMEVTNLAVRSFAGLDSVKVVAHPRHVSDSVFLHPFDPGKRDPRVWEPEIFDPYGDLRRKLALKKNPGLSGR